MSLICPTKKREEKKKDMPHDIFDMYQGVTEAVIFDTSDIATATDEVSILHSRGDRHRVGGMDWLIMNLASASP